MNKFVLYNKNGSIETPSRFIYSCDVFVNMFEDLGPPEQEERIYISDTLEINSLKKIIEFHNDFDSLNLEGKSYIDYISDNREDLIQNYLNKDKQFPYFSKIIELCSKYNKNCFREFIILDKFLNNKKLIRVIMLCLICLIKNGDDELGKSLFEILNN